MTDHNNNSRLVPAGNTEAIRSALQGELTDLKNNLDVSFGTGGHGLVHSYIPLDEIWISPVVEKKWSLALHEITEFNLMKKLAMKYKEAHKKTTEVTQGIKNKKEANTKEL